MTASFSKIDTAVERARVLVVDDETEIRRVLETALTQRGYEVCAANNADAALSLLSECRPHVVLTDLLMPNVNGVELCRAIRRTSDIPIIVVSVRSEEQKKVEALENGADDYVTKPFGIEEVVARIRAALRRAKVDTTNVLVAGDFRLDISAHCAMVRGQQVYLTRKEFELLAYLVQNAGKVLTHRALLVDLWARQHTNDPDVVRVLVRQLRKKIEPNPAVPKYLKTEPWIGYRLDAGD